MASVAEARKFIEQIAPLIQSEAKKRGYSIISAIIAQACVESAFGTSSLGYKYHNYFGMKCGSSWKGKSVNLKTKEEYTTGTLTTIRDNFRVYDSMEEGVKGYFDFISTSRYANLKTAVTSEMYLSLIKADGYATSSKYITTCMNCVIQYGLQTYDGKEATNPYSITKKLLKKGDTGDSVRWLQFQLNRLGYGLTIDGSFGTKTEMAVKDFQTKKLVDGIVGEVTLSYLNKVQ